MKIKEQKDRKQNPYYVADELLPLEDDYSEESDANSVCEDNSSDSFLDGSKIKKIF